MAVIDVIKMWSRSSGSFESPDLHKRTAKFKDGYTIAHDVGTEQKDILSATGLPKVGETFQSLVWVFAKRQVIVEQFLTLTIVEIEYEGEVGPGDLDDANTPIDDPPEIHWKNVKSTEPVDTDAYGYPLTTTLGEPVEGLTADIDDLMLSVKRNYIGVNLAATHDYLRSTNSDNFEGFAAGLGHLTAFDAHPVIAPNGVVSYYEVQAEVVFRVPQNPDVIPAKVWWHRYLNQGWRFKTADNRIVNAFEDNQANVNRPILIKEDGTLVTDETDKGQVHWVERPKFPYSLPYGALGLTS